MAFVLTTSSNVTCGHAGKVTTVSAAKLTINGSAVLVKSDIDGKAVSACSTPAASDASGPTAKACTSVSSVDSGTAQKLTVGSVPVMLDTLSGTTDGMVAKVTPQKLLSATAVQAKLTTT